MADFIVVYMGALAAAGDPNLGSLLGDTAAPVKADSLQATREKHRTHPMKTSKPLNPVQEPRHTNQVLLSKTKKLADKLEGNPMMRRAVQTAIKVMQQKETPDSQ